MQNSLKIAAFGAVAIAAAFAAVPALAQTYSQSYYTSGYTTAQPQYYTSAPSYPTYTGYSTSQSFGNCPALSYNLTLGSSDRYTAGQVSMLQTFLRNRYGDARLTGGYYGSLTAYYVTRFQQESGVYPATGGVGQLTRAAIARTCQGQSYPGYPTYPTNPGNNNSDTTFRLDRNFALYEGDSARLSNGQLEVSLQDIDTRNDEATFDLVLACRAGTYCIYAPSKRYTLEDGDDVDFQGYNVELVSFTSTKATFRVTDNDDNDDNDNNNNDDATIDLTAPTGSKTVDQGDTLKISWESSDEPNDAAVILDLYTSGGSKVGTIAISSDTDASYTWHVPERNTFCTAQYPNALCGYDLSGRYYVRASLVEGNGFNGGDVLDTDTSATFTVQR